MATTTAPTDSPLPSRETVSVGPTPRWRGIVAAVLAALAALAVAELVAGIVRGNTSPVVSVGEWVIDHVPPFVKEFAVSTFGTNDKPALIGGTLVLLIVFAVVIGALSTRRRWVGIAGIVAFGLAGVGAALTRPGAGPSAAFASLVGTGVALAVFLFLLPPQRTSATHIDADDGLADGPDEPQVRNAPVETGAPQQHLKRETSIPGRPSAPPGFDRRAFLVRAAAVGGASIVVAGAGKALQGRFDVSAARSGVKLPAPASPAAPLPAGVDLDRAGLTPFMTSNADFYRVDTALIAPQISPESWQLTIHGMVDHELTFSYDDLLNHDLVERNITLVCVSNEVGGSYAGTARWLGVPLKDLLDQAGVNPAADQLVSRSTDGWTAGTPTAAVMDGRDALVAIGMNGEPLPINHGFPARLVVPGLYGYTSATKWLTELELTTFDAFDAYWVQRTWAKKAPIKTLTRIDTPRGLSSIPAGRTAVAGVAWAIHRGIDQVEVRIDDGPWRPARLGEVPNNDTWRQWVFDWDATSGSHNIAARATDSTGQLQTEDRANPIPDGASGWHSIVTLVQ
jgi:DMSO/TMAO reductase YedYZ molybdopterin-dependent catalytic subunit